MIDFNAATQTFNLILAGSVYAFQVDGEGRLVHLAWAPRPAGAADTDVIDGHNGYETTNSVASLVNRLSLLMGPCFQPRIQEQPSFLPDFRRRPTAQTEDCRFRVVERAIATDFATCPTH